MVQAQATAKYVRTSAQKAGLVLDLIRGKNINHALSALQFSKKSVAKDVAKVLRSAVANAQQKEGFSGDLERLFVSKCHADNGPSMKRVRPAPMGRAFRVVKRTTHLTVQVTEKAEKIKAVGGVEGSEGKAASKQGGPSAVAGKSGGTGGKQKGKKSGRSSKTSAKRGGASASR
jgi:large subunit ribosomal protein L22